MIKSEDGERESAGPMWPVGVGEGGRGGVDLSWLLCVLACVYMCPWSKGKKKSKNPGGWLLTAVEGHSLEQNRIHVNSLLS